MLSYLFRYKFTILLAIAIILLSLLPSTNIPGSRFFSIPHLDKFVHLSMYTSIGFVALMECRCRQKCKVSHTILVTFLFIMSFVIEVLQAILVVTREAEWYDLLANFLGLVTGYVIFRILRNLRIFSFLRP